MRLVITKYNCSAACVLSFGIALSSEGAQGLKVFHIGNSLTDQSYAMHNIAIGKGYTGVQYGRHMIPGAPIHWLWSHQTDGFRQALGPMGSSNSYSVSTSEYLASTPVDVLVLQLFPQNGDNAQTMAEYGGNFAEAAYRGNPNCQVYVFGSYPSADANFASTMASYNTMAVQGAQGISARFPNRKPVLVIPVMQAFQQVGPSGLYQDGVHANDKGKYVQALTHFATIYKADPHGAITSGLYMWSGNYSVDPSFAATAQDVVWRVVTGYPQSGVSASTVLQPIMPVQTAERAGYHKPATSVTDLLGRWVAPLNHGDCRPPQALCRRRELSVYRTLIP